MKKLLIASLLSFLGVATFGQGITVIIPTSVLHSFTALYPDIKDVNWNYNEPNYEANFKLRNKGIVMMFDESGYVNEVKNEIQLFELPVEVNTFITRDYPGYRVNKALHIDINGTAYYETAIKKDDSSLTLVFDRSGDLMITVMQ